MIIYYFAATQIIVVSDASPRKGDSVLILCQRNLDLSSMPLCSCFVVRHKDDYVRLLTCFHSVVEYPNYINDDAKAEDGVSGSEKKGEKEDGEAPFVFLKDLFVAKRAFRSTDPEKSSIFEFDGSYNVTLKRGDPVLDWALLAFSNVADGELFSAISICPESELPSCEERDELFVYGAPIRRFIEAKERSLTCKRSTKSYCESYSKHHVGYANDFSVVAGCSGGCVVDSEGRAVALHAHVEDFEMSLAERIQKAARARREALKAVAVEALEVQLQRKKEGASAHHPPKRRITSPPSTSPTPPNGPPPMAARKSLKASRAATPTPLEDPVDSVVEIMTEAASDYNTFHGNLSYGPVIALSKNLMSMIKENCAPVMNHKHFNT